MVTYSCVQQCKSKLRRVVKTLLLKLGNGLTSVPKNRSINYKTLQEGDPLPVPQQKRNINVVLPETYIVERLVWRKKNDQVSMIINLLLRFQDYQQTTLVDKHLTKPTHKNFTAKLKKCVNVFHADCFLKILF